MPNTTDNCALERSALLYVDLAGTIKSESVGESRYVTMIVGNFSCFKVSKFLKTKSSVVTAAALASYIVTYITSEQVSVPFAPTTEASLRENPKENLINWAYNTSTHRLTEHNLDRLRLLSLPTASVFRNKGTNHAPISFDQQSQVSPGHTSYRNKEN